MVISFPEFLEYIDEISVTPWCRDAHFFIPSPTVVNDSLYFCQGDLAIVLLWPIPIDDFCHEFVLFKWQNFRENLASIPHFPEHETKTVYITSGAVLAWLKYFGCCINHTTLGYFIPTDNANVWKLNTFIWSNLKQWNLWYFRKLDIEWNYKLAQWLVLFYIFTVLICRTELLKRL